MAANRTLPDGTTEITGADLMDEIKAEVEAVSRGNVFVLQSIAGTDTITASALISIPGYYDGMRFVLIPANNNTGGATLNVDSKGAKSLRTPSGGVLTANTLVAGQMIEVIYRAGVDQFWLVNTAAVPSLTSKGFVLGSQQTNGTAGGTATAGAWTTYPINTSILNELSGEGAGLSSNVITLPAGTYDFWASAIFNLTGLSKLRLFNITDNIPVASQGYTTVRAVTTNEQKTANVFGRFTISSTKTFRLEYRVGTTRATDGLGGAASFTETEQYGVLMFMRPAEGGVDGLDGADGSAGYQYVFSTSTTDSDPGPGTFRFNNATKASVTQIFMDILENQTGGDITAILDSWATASTSTIKGRLHITGLDDSTDYADYEVTGVTTATGYRKISVNHIASSGTFSGTQRYYFQFTPKGDKGDKGDTGATGPNNSLDYQWATSTSGDPGAGYVGLNNATYGSATQIRIDDVDRNGANMELLLQALDDSNSFIKAHIYIYAIADRTKFFTARLTSVFTDQTGYWVGTIVPVSAGSTLSNGDIVSVDIMMTGDAGGLQAANNLSDVSDAATALANLGGLKATNNLSDVNNAATSRNNIGAEPQKVPLAINSYTAAAVTLGLVDAGALLKFNRATAQSITIPPNSSVAFPVGTLINWYQYGAGQVTWVAGSGVTIRSRGSKLKSFGQFAGGTLHKISTDEWILWGDLSA